MRILTVRRPWAWALIHSGKSVENRQTNIAGDYRGTVAIHAGKQSDGSVDGYDHPMMGLIYPPCPQSGPDHNRYTCTWCTQIEPQRHAHAGHIIGVADLVDVHNADWCWDGPGVYCSPWAESHTLHLVFTNPRPLADPIPYRGMLGLRTLDADTTALIQAAIA